MTDLAKLVVKLEAQTAQYMAQLDKATTRLARFDKQSEVSASRIAKGLAAAAVGAATAFAVMGKQAIDNADRVLELSQSTGISTEMLSQLELAATTSGTTLEELAKSTAKLSKNQMAAAQGSKAQSDAFDRLGISATNADGTLRSTDEVLLDVADKFSKMKDGATKAALAQEFFGKSGAKLIPFLNMGRDGIEEMRKEADALGLTISGKTARAADQFNDNLGRLAGASKGLANQFVEEALPTLIAISERFISAAKSGGALDFAIKVLSVAFKSLVTAGVIVTSVFEQLGRIIYGVGAAVVQVVQGEFRMAANEITRAFADARDNVAGDMETIASVWGDAVPAVEQAAVAMDDALEDTIVFSDTKAGDAAEKAADAALDGLKKLASGLREQVGTYGMAEEAAIRYRIAQGDLAEEIRLAGDAAGPYVETIIRLTDELEAQKRTTEAAAETQKSLDDAMEEGIRITEQLRTPAEEYVDTLTRLNGLLFDGNIAQETYNRAVESAQKTLEDASKTQNKFLEEANRSTQNILAQGLEEAVSGGVKSGAAGALQAFYEMLNKMAYQAIAANLAEKIFGGEGMGSGGGWAGKAMDFLGGVFGGSRDSGGRGRAGVAYAIGTGAQPETFVPDTSGTFYPAGTGPGGGQSVTQNIFVQGRVDERSARQLELESLRRQRSANARLG